MKEISFQNLIRGGKRVLVKILRKKRGERGEEGDEFLLPGRGRIAYVYGEGQGGLKGGRGRGEGRNSFIVQDEGRRFCAMVCRRVSR